MADNEADILAQFQEFLAAKQAKETEDAEKEDFDIEIWNEKGEGVRTRRSHAKDFLAKFGLDVDAEPSEGSGDNQGDGGPKTEPKTGRQSTGKTSNAGGTPSVARKYFVKSPPAK
jgi:hypothetical protein